MTLDSHDRKVLRWNMIGFGLALLISVAIVWLAATLLQTAEKENKTALVKRAEAKAKLGRASQDEAELTEKILKFQRLVTLGYTQIENRLDWVEQLERLRKKWRLSDFQYEFSAQEPLDASVLPGGSQSGGFDFLTSKQKVGMKVMHEGEVWSFLNDLKSEARALVVVRSCTFDRLPPAMTDRGGGPYLGAECLLDWITLRERK